MECLKLRLQIMYTLAHSLKAKLKDARHAAPIMY